jgi:hypothetical protein
VLAGELGAAAPRASVAQAEWLPNDAVVRICGEPLLSAARDEWGHVTKKQMLRQKIVAERRRQWSQDRQQILDRWTNLQAL